MTKPQTRKSLYVKSHRYDTITRIAREEGRARSAVLEEWIKDSLDEAEGIPITRAPVEERILIPPTNRKEIQ